MNDNEIKALIVNQYIRTGSMTPPDYLDNAERKIWNRVVASIEVMEMDHGQ
jgi:phage terminase small subunit